MVAEKIEGNLDEAHRLIGKAYELRDTDKATADWYKDMAAKHLEFNTPGHAIVVKKIAEYDASGKNSPLAPGMKAMYNDKHAKLNKRTSEVQSMISTYK